MTIHLHITLKIWFLSEKWIMISFQVSKEVEQEKLNTLGARNTLKTMAKSREQEQQKLQSLIVEKLMQYERLKLEHEALLKTEAQQHEFMEQFMLQK